MVNSSVFNRRMYKFVGIDDLLEDLHSGLSEILRRDRTGILAVGVGMHEHCNYNCVYCYVDKNTRRSQSEWMTISEYESLFQQAAQLGCRTIILTGAQGRAEPLMTAGLPRLLSFIHSNGMRPVIFTNLAVLGDASLCRPIHNIDPQELAQLIDETGTSLIVKCDTLDKERYDQMTAIEGSFDKFCAAVDLLTKCQLSWIDDNSVVNTRVSISTVISKNNFTELENLASFAYEKRWLYVCKYPSMMGSALENSDLFFNKDEAAERRDYTTSISDKTETLVLHDSTGDYCVIHQLGISFNIVGQPLSCLSGSLADFGTGDWTLRHKTLSDIVLRKKELVIAKSGECPKKGRFYAFKGYTESNVI